VDIVAPMGTPILAPFAGQAYTSSNSLGGNVVFVVGAQGTVYNAHLSRYSASSNSTVSGGEVIGYVGSTGSSSTPHDHFEFHPHAMPGPWPVSYYGYSVIEDAINPYPLLLQGCG
jgi:murein DD-endopeptidase MepM/ murein hydrolase activator NlpD